MNQGLSSVLCGFAALALLSAAPQDQSSIRLDSGARQMLASPDKAFAMNAAQSNLAQLQWGKLAEQKAANSELKAFGGEAARDYTKLNDELRTILAREHMTLPDTMAAKDQMTYDKLSRLSGAAFDKICAEEMLKAHRIAVKEFTRESKSGKDSNIRSFASDALPAIEQRLEKIRSIHSQIQTS